MGEAPPHPGPAALAAITHDAYEVDIGAHVFPMAKYRLVRDRLLAEGTIAAGDVMRPDYPPDSHIRLVHTPDYVDRILSGTLSFAEVLRLEVPFSDALREAAWLCAGGTTLTARTALERGAALHLGGGFHHAFADHGEGFCLIHDVAIAIAVLRAEGAVRRALVIDCDVHHGNGTAAIFAHEPDVFTFSMHQEHNYPAWKPPGDLDIGLADGTADDEYLGLLELHLDRVLDEHLPELAVYLAGADPYEQDLLGGLGLTLRGLRARDEIVLRLAHAAGIPVAIVLAGGYAARTDDTIEIHANTARAARDALARRKPGPPPARDAGPEGEPRPLSR